MKSGTLIGPAEINQSLEIEVGENIDELTRADDAFRQVEHSDDEMTADSLNTLVRRLSETPTRVVEDLIDELQKLRKKLQTDGDRIERDIAEYAKLSQQVMQLSRIITDSVKKLPSGIRR